MSMRRRRSLMKRTPTEWVVRSGLALVAAALGYASVVHSLAYVSEARDPARAHALASGDGRITAALAAKSFGEKPDGDIHSSSARLARLALRQDPTAVDAVATLGFQAQLRGDTKQARRLFVYAEGLSRRNLSSQLWIIENAVASGDVSSALLHYDIALRTSNRAPDLLFPVLGTAIAEPDVRRYLAIILRKNPIWANDFVGFVAAGGVESKAVVQLFASLHGTGVNVSPEASSFIINRLISDNAIIDAWRYYALIRGRVDRRMSRDPRFLSNLSTPSVFDWVTTNDASIVTSIQHGQQGGFFDFTVPSGTGGLILQQRQLLPPGAYRLEGRSSGIEQADHSLPYWALTCSNGIELARVIVPRSTENAGRFVGSFNVPTNCQMQTLALFARSSDTVSGATGQINSIRLLPRS